MAFYADSAAVFATADPITGLELFDPANPETIYKALWFTSGARQEALAVGSTSQGYTSRVYPEVTFSANSARTVGFTILVPSDSDEKATVAWLRARVRARKAIAYRDNRGRYFEAFLGGISVTDDRAGTLVGMTLSQISYGG